MKDTINEKAERKTSREIQADSFVMRIPETSRKPEHHKATASIYVEGLSILCPNETDQTAEIAFVKENHSAVAVKVYKNGCEPYWSSPIFDEEEKIKIEIQKSNPKGVGSLYKDSKKYDADFAWMPDLNGSNWHPQAEIRIKSDAKQYLSAKLILKDAHFYTHLKSAHDGLLSRGGAKPVNIGRIGRILGADIVCDEDDTEVVVRIETSSSAGVIDCPLPKDEGPFFISVITRPGTPKNHLHHLYHHIIELPPGEPELDFRYEKEEGDWYLCEKPKYKLTTFACQTFPGGNGPLPPFP